MGQDQFHVIMPVICADLISLISTKRNLSATDAIKLLYTSELYALLEKEETKVWQYSTPMLYSLLEQEWLTGAIRFPDV